VITTSGATISGGLTFPATQVASEGANVLDDYEEGTWTPALTADSCTFTYSKQYGGYTKVGRLILAHFEIATTGAPSGVTTNNVQMNAPIAGINPSGFTTHAAGMSYAPLLDSDGQVAIVYLHNPSDSEKSIASIFTGESYFNGVLMYNTTA
jgi:hypothetical protein